jgi:hypothetical protein
MSHWRELRELASKLDWESMKAAGMPQAASDGNAAHAGVNRLSRMGRLAESGLPELQ